MANGCGAEGSWFKPPHSIFFHTSCDKHDELYGKGRTLWDKVVADALLFKYMTIDCFRLEWYRIPFFLIWAVVYFVGLTIGGYPAFYKNKQDNF